MKLVAYILLISCFLAACSKEVTDPNTYRVTVKENFTDPLKQLKNIQVDDYVPYIITLADSKEGGEYRLTSLKEGEQYHQTIGKDFVLSLTNNPNTPIDKEQKYITFTNKGTHNFYIRPLVPGTFKLTFELQKFVGDAPIGDAIKVNVSFNAVKIRVWRPRVSLISIPSYTISLDDGNGEGDDYISNKNVMQSFYAKILINDSMEKEVNYSYIDYRGKRSYGFLTAFENIKVNKVFVKHMRVSQKEMEQPEFVIEYYNIAIDSIE